MKTNKYGLSVFCSLLLLLFLCLPAYAQPTYKAFSLQGVALTNIVEVQPLQYVVVPAKSAVAGPAVLQYINFLSPTNQGRLTFSVVSNFYQLDATNAVVSGAGGATNIPTLSTTNTAGILTNVPVLIRHLVTETYERNRVLVGTTTNIILQYPLLTTTTSGDILYVMQTNSSIFVASNGLGGTIGPVGGGGIAYGQLIGNANMPWMIDIAGTNAAINSASGSYLP